MFTFTTETFCAVLVRDPKDGPMKSLRINRGVAAGATAVSLLFTATGVAAPSLLSQAAAEATSKNLALKCTYTAPIVGTKNVETAANVTVDMPTEVDAGADIPVKVTTGDAKISSLAFGAVKVNGAKNSTVRLHVSPNAELVGSPQGITLANGVLSISNVLSASKTASQVITVTAKPAEFTLRSKDGKAVTVAAPADVIELTMSTSLGDVPTKCATTAVQLNQTTIKAAPAPEPTPEQPDPAEPDKPTPGETEKPGETTPEQPDPTQPDKPTPGETDKPGEPEPTETDKPGEPEPDDPPANKDPQGSSTDGIASFFKKIFGIDKSDEGKNTAKTFWSALFGGGLLAVIISAVLNFIR